MIRTNNSVDNTPLIRELKHSSKIWDDVKKIMMIKKNKNLKLVELELECIAAATFLYTNYTMIFNRILRDGIDVTIFYSFLGVLKEIEDGILDQHEASFKIGTLLKQMYIDPKLEEVKEPTFIQGQSISWQEFKKIHT